MARDNARPVSWWRWCARGLLAVCALAVLIVGVANVVTVAATRDRVVTVEGAASALASDPADAVVVLGASVPITVNSRSAAPEEKYDSIAIAAAMAQAHET